MNLAGIFGNNSIQTGQDLLSAAGIRETLDSSENTLRANQLIKNLIPGQTLQAQIMNLDGENATLKLANNALIRAALGQSAAGLDVGKLMSFEVRGNGQTLSLSPLFTNTASDPTVQKALTMAGLPLNQSSAQMTGALMQAGLPIDRGTLTGIYSEIVNHAEADVLDIVDLHRLNLPVTEENLQQLSAYKNLSYQLDSGMQEVADKLQGLLSDLAAQDPKAGTALLDTMLQSLVSALEAGEGSSTEVPAQPVVEPMKDQPLPADGKEVLAPSQEGKETEGGGNPTLSSLPVSGEGESASAGSAAQRALDLLTRLNQSQTAGPESAATESTSSPAQPSESLSREEIFRELGDLLKKETGAELSKDAGPQQILTRAAQVFHEAVTSGNTELAQRLLSSKAFTRGIFAELKDQWTISPEEVAKKENVEKLFSRLNRQLGDLSRVLEETGQTKTPAFQAVSNMSANVDFLQQVNQMYAYIQLPIRLSQGDTAHGDLYVYTNGRKLSQNDGHVSALLHLDMEHLGPVDVYVAMDTGGSYSRVSTQFYLPDEDTLDFLNEHMGELTARLEKRGYNCSSRLTVRGQEDPGEETIPSASGINMLLVQKNSFGGAEKSFDVRT